jgi:hypothetical protein
MANDAAWQAGVDIASGRKKKDDSDSDKGKSSSKPIGGLMGLEQKGMSALSSKLRGQSGARKAAGGAAPASTTSVSDVLATPSVFKHGGRVKRTGVALVHRGEYVIPAKRSGKKTRIIASQAREPLSPAKHGKSKRTTKIVHSQAAKR